MSSSKSILWPIVVLACVLGMVNVARGTTYTGSLSWDDCETELKAWNGWKDTDTTIAWTVTGAGMDWHYKFDLTFGGTGGLSHIIIETTKDIFTEDSLTNAKYKFKVNSDDCEIDADFEVGDFTAGGSSNPNMPENVYGVKFEGFPDLMSVTIEFDSIHMPEWKDYFCGDGSHNGFAQVWNAGFTSGDTDPTDPPGDDSVDYHILAPNSIIPEPLTVLGLVLGLGSVGAYIKRRRMA